MHEMSPNIFLQIGLELEEQQSVKFICKLYLLTYDRFRRALLDESKGKKTTLKAANLQEKRNVLHRRIEAWRVVQAVYMPAVNELFSSSDDGVNAERKELRLPSAIPSALQVT
jgi:hypothetical protein